MNKLPAVVTIACLIASPSMSQEGKSSDDLAKELSNPGGSNATLNFKLEYRTFDGDIDDADEQDSTTLTFQPVFPFKLKNGNNLIFRPAFSYVWGQPSISADGFSDTDSFGDIPFDLLYAQIVNGATLGFGVVGAIPTSSDISSENILLGPSLLYTKPTDWGIWGLFPFHNEKISGDGPDFSVTSLQYFLFGSLGGGWQFGTGPTITYDWYADEDDRWTVPIQLTASKTTAIGSLPIKISFTAERNVIAPEDFSEDWTYTLTMSPVISNPLQPNPPKPPVDTATRAAVLEPISR